MLFNSYIFILLFLPLTVMGYYLIAKVKPGVAPYIYISIMSLWFYAYANVKYLPALIINTGINYVINKMLQKEESASKCKFILGTGLVFNIGSLCYYKYFDFFVDNINSVLGTDIVLKQIILPLGISYVVFQQIALLVDTYRKETENYSFVEYLLFVIYFPKIISGPIVLHDEFFPQLRREDIQKVNWDNLSRGIYIFAIGMGKKVLLADTFGKVVNSGFTVIDELYAVDVLIVMLAYTFQIYFDFSGYSDMAIGISKMLNIDLPINFDSPYKSLTIIEFWSRWHMTLTRFLTKYIYIPLGGNRKGVIRTYVNIFLVFLVSGIWHGAGWTFVIWGIMHGVFQIITKMFKKQFDKMHSVLSWMMTFMFLNVSWLIFRAGSIKEVFVMLKTLFRLKIAPLHASISEAFELVEFRYFFDEILDYDILSKSENIYVFAFIMISMLIVLGCSNTVEKMKQFKGSIWNSAVTVILFVWCILSFEGVSTFLYFNF